MNSVKQSIFKVSVKRIISNKGNYSIGVKDLYANNKTLGGILQLKIFQNERRWLTPDTNGEDYESETVLHDPKQEKMMIEFDKKLQRLTEGIFYEKYLKNELVPHEA